MTARALPVWKELWALLDPTGFEGDRARPYGAPLDPDSVPWVETTPAMVDHMLQCVPPIYVPGGFLCSEPYTEDPEGRDLYAGFIVVAGRMYAKYTNPARWSHDVAAFYGWLHGQP